MQNPETDLVVVILTFNSENIIEKTVRAAQQVSSNIVCVDSGSTDGTRDILESLGCRVLERPFKNYSDQRNWIIKEVESSFVWQLHIDSDEVLDEEAITTIRQTLSDPQQGEAFLIRRRTYFMGKHLRFGGTVTWHLRLFRSGTAQCEDRLYDQHFVSPLPASKLVRGALHDMNIGNLTEWTSRHNHWSDLEAREILKGDEADPSGQLQASISGDPRERTRFLKGLYYRGPLLWRAGLYFFYRYILRGGFLDGRTGFIFNFLQAFWFRILIDAKIVELRLRESQPQERP